MISSRPDFPDRHSREARHSHTPAWIVAPPPCLVSSAFLSSSLLSTSRILIRTVLSVCHITCPCSIRCRSPERPERPLPLPVVVVARPAAPPAAAHPVKTPRCSCRVHLSPTCRYSVRTAPPGSHHPLACDRCPTRLWRVHPPPSSQVSSEFNAVYRQ